MRYALYLLAVYLAGCYIWGACLTIRLAFRRRPSWMRPRIGLRQVNRRRDFRKQEPATPM